MFEGKEYTVGLSGKPTCQKGEPKTDIYILAKSDEDDAEINEMENLLKRARRIAEEKYFK